jgi:hypothetical protein
MVDRTKEWKDLPRLDPAFFLRELRKVETRLSPEMDPRIRALRDRGQERFLEARQGCLFCYGMSHKLGVPVAFIPVERQDYDGVAVWLDGDTEKYCPLQLKELVPAKLNPNDTINARLSALKKYGDSADLTVVIHHTREGRFEPNDIHIPTGVKLAGIYVFAGITPDQNRWVLLGDLAKNRNEWTSLEFDYPT